MIDGVALPWAGVLVFRINELSEFHTEMDGPYILPISVDRPRWHPAELGLRPRIRGTMGHQMQPATSDRVCIIPAPNTWAARDAMACISIEKAATSRARSQATAGLCLWAITLLLLASATQAQDIEPRSYSNAPVGVNFLIAGYAYTRGGVAFDTALPISNPKLYTDNAVLAYARVLDLWGKSANASVIVPYTWLAGSAERAGDTVERAVNGFGEPTFRLSMNLYGAPALDLKQFQDYTQELNVGAILRVTAPWGQYDSSKVVNITTNRWSFKPELGISKALGQWTLEGALAATFYTDNTNFFNGQTRSQDPLYAILGHVSYSFPKGIWASLDATYVTGGRSG